MMLVMLRLLRVHLFAFLPLVCLAYGAALEPFLYVQVIQEVFCWTRLPMEVRRLAARKEDLFRGLLGDTVPAVPPGASSLLELLLKNKVREHSSSGFGMLSQATDPCKHEARLQRAFIPECSAVLLILRRSRST